MISLVITTCFIFIETACPERIYEHKYAVNFVALYTIENVFSDDVSTTSLYMQCLSVCSFEMHINIV